VSSPFAERAWAVLKTVIFTVVVPGTVTLWIPFRWLLPRGATPVMWGAALVGVAPLVLGVALYFWCAWEFAWRGLGTPAPIDPPKILVARGPYRVVRNPMYAGVLSVVAGEALWFWSRTLAWYAAFAALMFHLFVVIMEEPMLRAKFGASYEEYCRSVPRWIPLPGRRAL